MWCKLEVYEILFPDWLTHACVYSTSKNPKDDPNSCRTQRALALAYDGDADMWSAHDTTADMCVFCSWHHNSCLCNSETSWDKPRSFQLQEQYSLKPSPVPLHVVCVLLWFDCIFFFFFTKQICTGVWAILKKTAGELLQRRNENGLFIFFVEKRLPLCTILVQYQVKVLWFCCLYCKPTCCCCFLWCWLFTLLEADYHC